jgi:uncharacterized protein (TIGR02285 family)
MALGLLASAVEAATRPANPAPPPSRSEPITWTLLGIPPNTIPINGEPSDGQFDLILKLVIAQMPGREHKFVYANTGRIVTMLQEGFPACYISSTMTPERKAVAHLTVNGVVPPLRLLVRKSAVPKLPRNAQQEVVLEQLLARTDLTTTLEQGRSYSANIDAAVEKVAPNITRSRTQSIQMLRNGRVDYTIGFDTQLNYELRTGERLPLDAELTSLPIAGEQVRYTAFACPRTPWGQAMIDELDVILRRLAGSPDYLAAMNKWLSAEERERMRPVMREFLRLRATTSDFDDAPTAAGPARKPGPH